MPGRQPAACKNKWERALSQEELHVVFGEEDTLFRLMEMGLRRALTPAGEGYLDYARRALNEMAAGNEHLRSLRSELTGLIRLTATVSWGQRVLAKQLPEFARLHPAIEL